jgi:hypothetical protein
VNPVLISNARMNLDLTWHPQANARTNLAPTWPLLTGGVRP